MNAIQISDVTIHQSNNLYSLTDLHKASGSQDKHKPVLWLRNPQTQELIAEIEAESGTAVKTVHGGSNRGTYACKELVYAYATWISAKFFLQVIRTFDAVVSGSLKPQALPNGLTFEQQQEVKALHNILLQSVPLEKQKGLAITLWSAVKAKFKVGYKDVPPEMFPEVLSLMARVAVEKGVQYREQAVELETVPKLYEYQANIPFNLSRNESYYVRVQDGRIRRSVMAFIGMPHDDALVPCLNG